MGGVSTIVQAYIFDAFAWRLLIESCAAITSSQIGVIAEAGISIELDSTFV